MVNYSISRKLPFSKRRLPRKVIYSYIVDYVIIVILFIVFWAVDAIEPYHQHFSLNNYTLQYPYATKERVPVPLLFFLAIIAPAAIICLYTLVIDGIFSHKKAVASRSGLKSHLGKYRLKDRLWELNCGILGLLLASGTAFVVTGALKNAAGKPRPDLIDRCQPILGSKDGEVYGLSSSDICTQTDNRILKDGFRSFPSGHSSSAFGGLFYLTLYLAGKLHVLDSRGEVWKAYIVLLPTLAAGLIAISRIMDARHHPFDVISGSMLGVLTAFCAYRQYFPPISESWRKGRAYPIRSWGSEPTEPSAKQEEREVARDQGVEPLRTATIDHDEERIVTALHPLRQEQPAVSSPNAKPVPNVFRQQVSETERLRPQGFEQQRGGPSSNYSANTDPRVASNPYSMAGGRRSRQVDEHASWSSSESDHEESEGGYEMQPNYALTDTQPQIGRPPHQLPNSEAPMFEQYTAYSPKQNPSVPPSKAISQPHLSLSASNPSSAENKVLQPEDNLEA